MFSGFAFNDFWSFTVKWAEGENEIHVIINELETTIRFFVSDGKIDSFNAFIGASERLCDNIINLI